MKCPECKTLKIKKYHSGVTAVYLQDEDGDDELIEIHSCLECQENGEQEITFGCDVCEIRFYDNGEIYYRREKA